MAQVKQMYHAVVIQGGKVIYLPTSIPDSILPFVDQSTLHNKELEDFKQKIKSRNK